MNNNSAYQKKGEFQQQLQQQQNVNHIEQNHQIGQNQVAIQNQSSNNSNSYSYSNQSERQLGLGHKIALSTADSFRTVIEYLSDRDCDFDCDLSDIEDNSPMTLAETEKNAANIIMSPKRLSDRIMKWDCNEVSNYIGTIFENSTTNNNNSSNNGNDNGNGHGNGNGNGNNNNDNNNSKDNGQDVNDESLKKIEEYQNICKNNEINGTRFLSLNRASWKKFGMRDRNDITRILTAVRKSKTQMLTND